MTDAPAHLKIDPATGEELVSRTTFEKEAVWLPFLAVKHWNAGQMSIRGKTFTDCVIEGPAVMAVMDGTTFESCTMGMTSDTANLLYKAQGKKLAGVVGMAECTFVRCRFVQVGFTGTDEFVEQMRAGIISMASAAEPQA